MIHLILFAGLTGATQGTAAINPASAPTSQAVSVPAAPAFDTVPLDTSLLETTTARENLAQIASAEQSARVSNNSVTGNSQTGTVTIDGNAFQNLSGLAIINANSGNNVAINAALNVNIQFSPAQ